ncbi:MAG: hypothetical protein E6G85_30275 [Alphaproteobacteria bacterium]|nr:MAG: hypothetical protein E6G85_30275 [Alphaproteobacteria bacterium]
MSLFFLDAVLWTFGVRGHIPHCDDFNPGRGVSPVADSSYPLRRMLAALTVSVALLSLALWAVVWLTIRLL